MEQLKKTFSQIKTDSPPKKYQFCLLLIIPNLYDLFPWNTKKTFSPFHVSEWVQGFLILDLNILKKKTIYIYIYIYILEVLVALHFMYIVIIKSISSFK